MLVRVGQLQFVGHLGRGLVAHEESRLGAN